VDRQAMLTSAQRASHDRRTRRRTGACAALSASFAVFDVSNAVNIVVVNIVQLGGAVPIGTLAAGRLEREGRNSPTWTCRPG